MGNVRRIKKMPLWKIIMLSAALLKVGNEIRALLKIVKLQDIAVAFGFLRGWRLWVDFVFVCGVLLLVFDVAMFVREFWMIVFLISVYTAIHDLFAYPKQIKSEPYVDREFIRESRIQSLFNVPIYIGLFIYAFLSPQLWEHDA